MKHNIISIFIIFYLILFSCNESEPINGLRYPIEGNVIFTVIYDITEPLPSQTGYFLVMESEKIYTCYNFEIMSSKRINSQFITIDLHGIYRPEICATALGPARLKLPLEISNGIYDLQISYRNDTDRYGLEVAGLVLKVTKIDTSFTKYKPWLIYR